MSGAKNCPETPRQKMIGMMYLVLTAMLALNVSTDVLKAFKLVDDSLHTTLATTEGRNKALMDDFRAMRDENPQKVAEWYNKANELTQRSDSVFNYIQSIKYGIAVKADKKNADPEARVIEANDNREAAAQWALPNMGEQPGVILRKMIEEYRDYLISLDSTRVGQYGTMFDTSSKPQKDGELMSWEFQMFHDMPAGAAVALMTKLQNDVRNAQLEMIQHLRKQTDAGDVRVNKLQAYVIPKSDYVLKGSKYRATIVLAGIDSTKTPEYFVEGSRLAADGVYEVSASTIGHKKYSGYISYIEPTGETKNLPFTSDYTVAEPAVTVSNMELNIMYREYENKFDISVPGATKDKIKVSATDATVKQKGDMWIIIPSASAKSVKVNVSAEIDGKMLPMGSKDYRVKKLPAPTAFFNSKEKDYPAGDISIGRLLDKNGYVNASYGTDGILDLPFTVTRFTLYANGQYKDSKNNKFTREQLEILGKLKSGSLIMIQDIRAIGPTGKEEKLTSLTFKLN